jgi:hypothetical protein
MVHCGFTVRTHTIVARLVMSSRPPANVQCVVWDIVSINKNAGTLDLNTFNSTSMNVCVLSRSRSSHIDPHAYVHAPSFCIVEHGLRSRPVARLDQTPRTQSASQSTPFVVTLMPKTVARFFGKGGVDCCMMGTGMGMAGWGCTAWSFSSFISFLSSLAVIPFSESEPFPLIQQWADYRLDMPDQSHKAHDSSPDQKKSHVSRWRNKHLATCKICCL